MTAPLVVYKDGQIWRWRCRRWICEASEFSPRQDLALRDGYAHLDRHDRAGFAPPGGKK